MNINRQFKFKNYFDITEGNRNVDFIVIHHTQADSIKEAISLYIEHKVSAHYLIASDGEVFCLVEENDIAYHAGVSFWNGVDSLNNKSIGIELVCENPFEIGFRDEQMVSLIQLCNKLKKKYNVDAKNIVGHSDIAYFKDSGFLDRKQDPSSLFNWSMLVEKDLAVYSDLIKNDVENCVLGEKNEKIKEFKKSAQLFGYKVQNLDDIFDDEMKSLLEVVKRRFLR